MKRGTGNATVAGRRMRRQIGVVKPADEEGAARLRYLEGRLTRLDSQDVAELLATDAVKGELTPALLLARLVGCFGEKYEGDRGRPFARAGKPRRKRREE